MIPTDADPWEGTQGACGSAVVTCTHGSYYLLGVAETELGNFDKGDQLLVKALALTSTTDTCGAR